MEYERKHECRLVVVADDIFPDRVALWEELLFDVDSVTELRVMLHSYGGDGETAVRLVRSAQARCDTLTIVLPDQAKSAATLIALGAHEILMGPASDLGPVDPQLVLESGAVVAAKEVIAAVDNASARVQQAPETYALWASLLSDVSALKVERAKAAIARSQDLLKEALSSCSGRAQQDVEEFVEALSGPLISESQSHSATFSADDAIAAGLPVRKLPPESDEWKDTWRLWSRYALMAADHAIYESARASQVISRRRTQ
ncbi:MAG: hypothetical protein Kow0010_27510 [Dehalococcoidia bacterium]